LFPETLKGRDYFEQLWSRWKDDVKMDCKEIWHGMWTGLFWLRVGYHIEILGSGVNNDIQ